MLDLDPTKKDGHQDSPDTRHKSTVWNQDLGVLLIAPATQGNQTNSADGQ